MKFFKQNTSTLGLNEPRLGNELRPTNESCHSHEICLANEPRHSRLERESVQSVFLSVFLCFLGFSCGLANLRSDNLNNNSSIQNSTSRGTFVSSAGRLTSKSKCIDNEDCVEMCDSMLNRLSLQEECYNKTEEEVQALRDTFNLLVIGRPSKLAKVDPEEMEKFLQFSPYLFRFAIIGFRRGWKENCKPNSGENDPREREDCKRDNYYLQDGYSSEGAAEALEWIARNNWLGEMLEKEDDDHVAMLALLDVLANGGQYPKEDSDKNGTKDSVCKWNTAFSAGSSTAHGRLNSVSNKPSGEKENMYEAFGADCIDWDSDNTNGRNYFMIAVDGDNPQSANLGHQVLKEICDGATNCLKGFYCGNIKEHAKVLSYMKDIENTIRGFNTTCP